MERYTTEDGSALPDELFDDYWRCRRDFVLWSAKDIETLRAVLEHEPDWIVRASVFGRIDKSKEPPKDTFRISALRDPHWRVRLLATLRLVSEDDEETLCLLAANDENETVRRAAADTVRELLREDRNNGGNERRSI